MTKKLFPEYNLKQTEKLKLTLTEKPHYLFAAKADDPVASVDYLNELHDSIVFGKIINASDVEFAVRRYNWETGTVYDMFQSSIDMSGKKYFVVTNAGVEYQVFKCLFNADGAPSTSKPDKAVMGSTYSLTTADGYVWKYLYSITTTEFDKFSTNTHIPVKENATLANLTANSSIEVVKVTAKGQGYNSYTAGQIQQAALTGNTQIYVIGQNAAANTGFYIDCALKITDGPGSGQQRRIVSYFVNGGTKTVVVDSGFDVVPTVDSQYEITPNVTVIGDGSGFQARAIVNPSGNTIDHIEITTPGQNYSYANLAVVGNTTHSAAAGGATLEPVFSPQGGHGKNIKRELGCRDLIVSVKFTTNENDTIPATNSYNTYGVLAGPTYRKTIAQLNNVTGNFVLGETVTQASSGATARVEAWNAGNGQLTLSNVTGLLGTGSNITGGGGGIGNVVSLDRQYNTFNQTTRFVISNQNGFNFLNGETVTQPESPFTGAFVFTSNTSMVTVYDVKGAFNSSDVSAVYSVMGSTSQAQAKIESIFQTDLINNSGQILYAEHVSDVTRSAAQSETIKLTLGF